MIVFIGFGSTTIQTYTNNREAQKHTAVSIQKKINKKIIERYGKNKSRENNIYERKEITLVNPSTKQQEQ